MDSNTTETKEAASETETTPAEDVLAAPSNGSNGASAPTEFPSDVTLKLTDAELDKFNLLRLKVEHNLQAIRVLELEQDRADREHLAQKHGREQIIKMKRGQTEPMNNEYLTFVRSLASKYKLHPQHMGIDDETGVLRDLRPDTQGADPY